MLERLKRSPVAENDIYVVRVAFEAGRGKWACIKLGTLGILAGGPLMTFQSCDAFEVPPRT